MLARRRLAVGVPVALALAGACAVWIYATPHDRRTLSPSQVELVITSEKSDYTIGERPKITATLTNRSGRPITLVPALDGSDFGRYPRVMFEITPPPNALPEEKTGRCGNTNGLMPSDFHVVQPNESFDVLGQWGEPPWTALNRGPGEYAVQLTYSTDEVVAGRWAGDLFTTMQRQTAEQLVGELLSEVPRVTVTSNILTLRFEDSFADIEAMLRNGTVEQARLAIRMAEQSQTMDRISPALVDSILKNMDWVDAQSAMYFMTALETASACIEEEDLARLWAAVESRPVEMLAVLPNLSASQYLLQCVLHCPGPNREGRLRYLMDFREVKDSAREIRGRLVPIDHDAIAALGETPGDDIDRVLHFLKEESFPSPGEFEALTREIARRSATSVSPPTSTATNEPSL